MRRLQRTRVEPGPYYSRGAELVQAALKKRRYTYEEGQAECKFRGAGRLVRYAWGDRRPMPDAIRAMRDALGVPADAWSEPAKVSRLARSAVAA